MKEKRRLKMCCSLYTSRTHGWTAVTWERK